MFTLRLLFSGACAFVPRSDGKRMWVFMPNELETYKFQATKEVPAHRAVIKFDLSNLCDSAGATIMQGNEALGVMYLNAYDLEILPGGGAVVADSLSIEGYDPQARSFSASNAGAPPRQSFSWVAPVEQVCASRGYAGAGRIDPDFLEPTLGPPHSSRLAARVHLREGNVYTYRRGDDAGRYIVWNFRPFAGKRGEGDHRQILASEVAVDITIASPFVELLAKDFRGSRVDSIRLAPVASGVMVTPPRVTVHVTNEEAERILDVPLSAMPLKIGEARVQDRVFEAFGKLSSTPPPRELMPIPVADYIIDYNYAPGAIAAAAPPCSPARMEPVV